jgi:hypothetical protein
MMNLFLKATMLVLSAALLTGCVEDDTYYSTQVVHTRAYYTNVHPAPVRVRNTYYTTQTPSAPPVRTYSSHQVIVQHAPDYRTYTTQTPPAPPVSTYSTRATPSAPPAPSAPTYATNVTPSAPPAPPVERAPTPAAAESNSYATSVTPAAPSAPAASADAPPPPAEASKKEEAATTTAPAAPAAEPSYSSGTTPAAPPE